MAKKRNKSSSSRLLVFILLILAAVVAVALLQKLLVGRVLSITGQTFYVSKNGNNSNGTSWANAWNELNRINWAVVAPGDTIVIDGGSIACPSLGPGYNCGMVYNSTLTVGKSGTSSAPITIRLASDSGRNGTVIIDGGITNWAGCSEYPSEPPPPSTPNGAGVRDTGIHLGPSQWIVIDGTKWGGIEVRNHTQYGLNYSSSQNVTARYLKVHHNSHQTDTTNNAVGVTQNWQSAHNTLSRAEIFRNGQDAVRGAGDYFTLEESYLHDTYCNHPDGIQSFVPTSNGDVPDDAGEVRGLIVRRNVFDKIGLQNVFLGENATHNSWNVDVTIHDNLFLNSDYVIKSKHGSSRNWNIHHNTIVNASQFAMEWCCSSPGAQAPMVVSYNVFSNVKPGTTAFYMPTGGGNTTFTNNCLFNTGSRSGNVSESGTITANPGFVSSSTGNYAMATGSACTGRGANITSVAQLVSSTSPGSGSSVPTLPPSQPIPTSAPSPLIPGLNWQAESGVLTTPFVSGGSSPVYISQSNETTSPASGGKATYTFNITTPGNYLVYAVVNAPSEAYNSLFVNIDSEPTTTMIWDIPVTSGFQNRIASWRGSGSVSSPELNPKTFNLTAGTHTLIIRGREANVQIDRIFLQALPPTPTPSPQPTSTPVPTPTPTPAPIIIEVESGTRTSPFTSSNGVVYQTVETTNPSSGGRLSIPVNITQTGNYNVRFLVSAPNTGNNSLFVNFDSEPTSPTMIWDVLPLVTSGFDYRTVSWRGNGSENSAQHNPKTFNLTAGTHTLIIRGREANTRIDKVEITPATLGVTTQTPEPQPGFWDAIILKLQSVFR